MPKAVSTALCWAGTLLPLIVAALSVAFWLPETIPTHFNGQFAPDAWGPSSHMFVVGAIMAAVSAMMAAFATFADRAVGMPFYNGPSNPSSLRLFMLGTIAFLDVLFVAIFVMTLAAI